MLKYFFPLSAEDRKSAQSGPARFFVRLFLKFAATMALVLAVMDAVGILSVADRKPNWRLAFIVFWSAFMAAGNLLAALRMSTKRVGTQ